MRCGGPAMHADGLSPLLSVIAEVQLAAKSGRALHYRRTVGAETSRQFRRVPLERAAEAKHELVNGEIVAMSGASPVHNLVAMNLGRRLGELVAAKPCVVLSSDQRVHVPATGLFAYPDLTVVCGRPE